jgi:hypothetical protein
MTTTHSDGNVKSQPRFKKDGSFSKVYFKFLNPAKAALDRVARQMALQAKWENRIAVAFANGMSPSLAKKYRLTLSYAAVARIIANEVKLYGVCRLSQKEIADRAGKISVRTVGRAQKHFEERGGIRVKHRWNPAKYTERLPNIIIIIDQEWIEWIKKMAPIRRPNEKRNELLGTATYNVPLETSQGFVGKTASNSTACHFDLSTPKMQATTTKYSTLSNNGIEDIGVLAQSLDGKNIYPHCGQKPQSEATDRNQSVVDHPPDPLVRQN